MFTSYKGYVSLIHQLQRESWVDFLSSIKRARRLAPSPVRYKIWNLLLDIDVNDNERNCQTVRQFLTGIRKTSLRSTNSNSFQTKGRQKRL
jgi:hypothetical protein